jgi:CTP synthase (UTP-ammonia lyase)
VLGLSDATSTEEGVPSTNMVIVPVSCPVPNRAAGAPKLSGDNNVRVMPDSLAFRIYGRVAIYEGYFCNYEVNLAYQERLAAAGLRLTGFGAAGEARIAESEARTETGQPHPFFFATLFQPALHSERGKPHPVIVGFMEAAARFKVPAANSKLGAAKT